jgi:hypothetical protein
MNVLQTFASLSGLHINLQIYGFMPIAIPANNVPTVAALLLCALLTLPIRYQSHELIVSELALMQGGSRNWLGAVGIGIEFQQMGSIAKELMGCVVDSKEDGPIEVKVKGIRKVMLSVTIEAQIAEFI